MMVILGYLPPPPGIDADSNLSARVVVLIVVGILSVVVLIAWLLKPLVAQRLRAAASKTTDCDYGTATESRQWHDSWQATRDHDAENQDSSVESARLDPVPLVLAKELVEAGVAPISDVPTTDSSPVVEVPIIADASENADIAGITETVRSLLERANMGRVRDGFALYSDAARARFRTETGMTVAEFATAFDDIPAPAPEQQAELATVTDVNRLGDGRIRALISYRNGGSSPSSEYFTFVRSTGDEWLIDEIETAR